MKAENANLKFQVGELRKWISLYSECDCDTRTHPGRPHWFACRYVLGQKMLHPAAEQTVRHDAYPPRNWADTHRAGDDEERETEKPKCEHEPDEEQKGYGHAVCKKCRQWYDRDTEKRVEEPCKHEWLGGVMVCAKCKKVEPRYTY